MSADPKTAPRPSTLVICCGALAREVVGIIKANQWDHMKIECLPANLHNDPERLPEGVRAKIKAGRGRYDRFLVLYGDCGTGGRMDRVIEEEGVEGIAGAHCYEIFTGSSAFADIIEDEPGCFFLTDFLARHFDKLVYQGLGLDRFPALRDVYFGRYKKLVYLAQTENPELRERAEKAADALGLQFETRFTGNGGFETFLARH